MQWKYNSCFKKKIQASYMRGAQSHAHAHAPIDLDLKIDVVVAAHTC